MIVLELVLEIVFEYIIYYLFLGIQRIGALIRWIPLSRRYSYAEVTSWNGNTRLGFIILALVIYLIVQ